MTKQTNAWYKKQRLKEKKKKSETPQPPTYMRLGVFEISEVLDFVPFDCDGEMLDDVPNQREYCGEIVHMRSSRYRLFKSKGTVCKNCGVEGSFFSLDRPRSSDRPHFNLYGFTSSQKEVMLTKDHIIPKSKGGPNILENYQILCCRCNEKKSNKSNDDFLRKVNESRVDIV